MRPTVLRNPPRTSRTIRDGLRFCHAVRPPRGVAGQKRPRLGYDLPLMYNCGHAHNAASLEDNFMSAAVDRVGKTVFLSSDRMIGLSDTIFGVAMTLQASTLLASIQTLKGSAADIIQDMRGQFIAVTLSFAISGSYWIVQQRRLAMIGAVTPLQALLHFLFLFLFVLLPFSTGIWGQYAETRSVVVIYGGHLLLIALVNLLLWIDMHRTVAAHAQIVRASLALALFVVALVLGSIKPVFAPYLWFGVFATSFIGPKLARRFF
jgi:uncharacterized membrane protein